MFDRKNNFETKISKDARSNFGSAFLYLHWERTNPEDNTRLGVLLGGLENYSATRFIKSSLKGLIIVNTRESIPVIMNAKERSKNSC